MHYSFDLLYATSVSIIPIYAPFDSVRGFKELIIETKIVLQSTSVR